jgi:hypothetical protein
MGYELTGEYDKTRVEEEQVQLQNLQPGRALST